MINLLIFTALHLPLKNTVASAAGPLQGIRGSGPLDLGSTYLTLGLRDATDERIGRAACHH